MIAIPKTYSAEYLSRGRITPVIDNKILKLIEQIKNKGFNPIDKSYPLVDQGEDIFKSFKILFQKHLLSSNLNTIKNIESFDEPDICLGCTQYIDNIYMNNSCVQVLEKEYPYHLRMQISEVVTIDNLIPEIPLIVSYPFSGGLNLNYDVLLETCMQLKIPVHLDCAWFTASKNLIIDFSHAAIASAGFSLSKGYGTGFNRIGLRYTKHKSSDSITLQNNYQMIPSMLAQVGIYFLNNLKPDHLWNVHADNYYKICRDFNLTPTNSIHQAMDGEYTVGVSNLLIYLENLNQDSPLYP